MANRKAGDPTGLAKEQFQFVLGVGLGIFGLVMIAGVIAGDTTIKDVMILPFMLAIFWVPGGLLLYLSRRSKAARIREEKDVIFKDILTLAAGTRAR